MKFPAQAQQKTATPHIHVLCMMKISGIKTPMMGLLFKLKRSFMPCFSLFITPTSLYSARLQGLFDQIKGDRCK